MPIKGVRYKLRMSANQATAWCTALSLAVGTLLAVGLHFALRHSPLMH